MSADSYHHQVEKAMRNKERLYNFDDFEDCLSACGTPVVMEARDFYDFKSNISTTKDTSYPLLKD